MCLHAYDNMRVIPLPKVQQMHMHVKHSVKVLNSKMPSGRVMAIGKWIF